MPDPLNPPGGGGGPPKGPSAEETQKMADQAKIASEYAKQLSAAIENSLRPLQKMTDMTKAVAEQIKLALGGIKDTMQAMQQTGNTIADVSKQMADQSQAAEGLNALQEQYIKLCIKSKEQEVERSKIFNANYAEEAQRTKARNVALEAELSLLEKIKKSAADKAHALARTDVGGGLMTGLATGGQIFTGKAQLGEALGSVGSAISGFMPAVAGIGGLIGMMLHGKMEEAKFHAIGEAASAQFNRVGGAGMEMASQLGSASRSLSKHFKGAEGDLFAVSAAFSAAGQRATTFEQEVEGFNSTLGKAFNNLGVASLAMDKDLQVPAGTFAKLGGMLSQQFNVKMEESLTYLYKMSSAMNAAGGDAVGFMESIMEANSSLRLMNANMGTTGATALSMFRGMKDQGFSAQFTQQYVQHGMGAAAQALNPANMDVGMSAVIGQKLGLGIHSGLTAWRMMNDPLARAQGGGGKTLDQGDIAAQFVRIAQQATPDKDKQAYMIAQLAHTDAIGAGMIMRLGEKIQAGGSLDEKELGELNGAFDKQAKQTSDIVRSLEAIKNGIDLMGAALLGIVVNTLKAIFNGIMILASGSSEERSFYTKQGKQSVADLTSSIGSMRDGFKEAFGGVKGGFAGLGITQGWDVYKDSGGHTAGTAGRLVTGGGKAVNKAAELLEVGAAATVLSSPVGRFVIEHVVRYDGPNKDKGFEGEDH